MGQEKSLQNSHSEGRKQPYKTLKRTEQYQTRTGWKMATNKQTNKQKKQNKKKEKKGGGGGEMKWIRALNKP